MSAKGHEQTSAHTRVMSVIPLKADISTGSAYASELFVTASNAHVATALMRFMIAYMIGH